MYYRMKSLKSLLQRIIPKELPKPLGRWKIGQCNQTIDSKIDLSNEDHCGPCGQYALDKIKGTNTPKVVQTNFLRKDT